jgi:hypothetical protein
MSANGMVRPYRPETTDMLRTCLGGCPDDMEVEIHPGVPLIANVWCHLTSLDPRFFSSGQPLHQGQLVIGECSALLGNQQRR